MSKLQTFCKSAFFIVKYFPQNYTQFSEQLIPQIDRFLSFDGLLALNSIADGATGFRANFLMLIDAVIAEKMQTWLERDLHRRLEAHAAQIHIVRALEHRLIHEGRFMRKVVCRSLGLFIRDLLCVGFLFI